MSLLIRTRQRSIWLEGSAPPTSLRARSGRRSGGDSHATGGRGVDVVFDAVGLASIETALLDALLPPAWRSCWDSAGGTTFPVEAAEFIRQENLTGSIRRLTLADFVRYAELYLEGRLPIDQLVTERYRLDEITEA